MLISDRVPVRLANRLFVVVVALLVAACDISPQPAPPGVQPEFRAEAITLTQVDPSTVRLDGAANAAPASTLVSLANVELVDGDGAIDSDAEGAFSITLGGQLGDVFRLNALPDGDRIELDVTGTTDGGPVLAVAPAFEDCVSLSPEHLVFGPLPLAAPIEQRVATLTNDCAQAVTIDSASLRDAAEFALLGPGPGQLPASVPSGGQIPIEVGFKGPVPGSSTDHVRVRFTDAAGPRRILSTSGDMVP